MDIDKIERYVSDLLTVSGMRCDGEGHRLWVLLHHLYSAVAMWEQLDGDGRTMVADMQQKLRYFFSAKCDLKERKRNKTEKESFPPHPLTTEKENKKEKDEKIIFFTESARDELFNKKKEPFKQQCLQYAGRYDNARLADFFNYWSEETRTTGRMRFEGQRYWDLEKRLARWMNTKYSADNAAAAIRLRKARKRQAEEAAATESQQAAAAEREQQRVVREQQAEQSRRGRMTTAEYIAQNPNGLVARLERERMRREELKNGAT